jgi:hypothetical protein
MLQDIQQRLDRRCPAEARYRELFVVVLSNNISNATSQYLEGRRHSRSLKESNCDVVCVAFQIVDCFLSIGGGFLSHILNMIAIGFRNFDAV